MTTHPLVLDFHEIDRAQVELVGGKGANLGELSRIPGLRVPAGFCVTTEAFRRVLAQAPSIDGRLDELSRLQPDDREAIGALTAEIRQAIEGLAVPDDLAAAITGALARLGEGAAHAVRSSATAEDGPTASFAGQQDSYLNVVGTAEVLRHVSRCWASLFTERAAAYRLRNGFDHHAARMAVVVQRMAPGRSAGVLFTADPVTGNRKVASIEASFGLGEALVSGRVNPDTCKVRNGEVVERTIGAKQIAVEPSPDGGTQEVAVAADRQRLSALTDAEAVALAELGRRIEAHFGSPQDIEWCLDGDGFAIVQSRPITTLFPIPEAGDGENHVWLSTGHQQMMTDPMKALGLSLFLLIAFGGMRAAGGRLWVDCSRRLASPAGRAALMAMVGKGDPLTGDALQTIIDRGFIPPAAEGEPVSPPPGGPTSMIETDPAIVAGLLARGQASNAALERDIRDKAGPELIDFILADIPELKRVMFDPQSQQAIMAGMEASWRLNEVLQDWLGETNAADVLTQSVPGNVTSEMGLALLDVADAIRPHPAAVSLLEEAEDDGFLDRLPGVAGGQQARDAICAWLDRYGMRCVGEIDITRPRWSERPSMLLPMLLGNVRNFEPGAAERRFEQGLAEARAKEQEVLARLRGLPDGEAKAQGAKRLIDRVRTFAGYREYPKYFKICRFLIYKRALMEEAGRLVREGVIGEAEDIFHLSFHELHEVVRSRHADAALIARRKAEFRSYEALTPPRVLTSDGEAVAGSYRREDAPAGALVGLAVSAGVVEGRARVVLEAGEADLEPGDILVTAFTDPSWTPLFVAIGGLVTEVGGRMSHGAVITREYGLPAVVGVENATRLIRDGQRIRVHGTEGYVEILD